MFSVFQVSKLYSEAGAQYLYHVIYGGASCSYFDRVFDSSYLNPLMYRYVSLIGKVNIAYRCRLTLISSIERFLAGL
jgi:hypothetical protein